MKRRYCTSCCKTGEWKPTHTPKWERCPHCGAMHYTYDRRIKAKRTGES